MKKLIKTLCAVAIAVSLTSCGVIPTDAGMGMIYTDMSQGETVTGNVLGSKVGTAQAKNILGAVVIGDASIQAAAKSAGIKKISHVDSKKTTILGIYTTHTTIVYGE